MPKLKSYRQYSEHDVINGLFSFEGSTANAGTIVHISKNFQEAGNTYKFDDLSNLEGSISSLFSCVGKVKTVPEHDSVPRAIGILIKNVAEYDENGIPLIYEPRMAAERDVVLPHQAVPILTRGLVLINDIDTSDRGGGGGDPEPGDALYIGSNGRFASDGGALGVTVGQFLSSKDSNGYCLVRFSF